MKNVSPRIITLKWGKMEVEELGRGRDFKLWPGGGRLWDWRETGTSHSPGIQVSDCEELVDHGCQVIILSTGVFKRLKVMNETVSFLQSKGVETIIASTKEGVKLYNDRVGRGDRVGGLFHSTC